MNNLPQWIIDAQQAYGHLPQQQESETNRLMVSLGHPQAEAYRRARNHFDQLAYAASAYHRFYSVADSGNYSMISPPDLMIIVGHSNNSARPGTSGTGGGHGNQPG